MIPLSSRPFDDTDPDLGTCRWFDPDPEGRSHRGLHDTDPGSGGYGPFDDTDPAPGPLYPRPWREGPPRHDGVPPWLVIAGALVVAGVILLGAGVLSATW